LAAAHVATGQKLGKSWVHPKTGMSLITTQKRKKNVIDDDFTFLPSCELLLKQKTTRALSWV